MYPSTMIIDYPTCFKVAGTTLYCPKNYDGGFHGPVQFRQALANSYNIPAVKVLAKNTLETFIATASAMGITTFTDPSRYGLSLTLGGGEVTMLDMATAFGTIANQGVKIPLHPILDITDYTGAAIYQYDPQATQETLAQFFNIENAWSNNVGHTESGFTRILNREPAFLISDILSDNNARASAFGSNSKLRIKDQTVSVKTGTTNDLKDNWTIGYNPDYLVAVWVGNNDSTPMNPYLVSGVTGAAPIWHDLMSYLLLFKADHPQPEPPGISKTYVCNVSGVYPSDENPCDTRSEIFWEEAMPKTVNQTRKNIWVNKDTGLPAFTNTGDPNAPPVDVNNLELREHTVVSDDFVTDFCLDCPWPQDDKGRIQYPKIIVDTTKDETALGSKSDTPPQ
jgi:membrane carboxypeptidase/penicillin-binding protein PbpC